MKKIWLLYLLIASLFIQQKVYAQDLLTDVNQDSLLTSSDSLTMDSLETLSEDSLKYRPSVVLTKINRSEESNNDGFLRVIQEERVNTLNKIVRSQPYEHNGFRIQIVFGTKEVVNRKRSSFESRFSYRTYVDWLPPNFRLRVGDFPTKQLAEKHLYRIRKTYPDSYIIKDKINTPSEYR